MRATIHTRQMLSSQDIQCASVMNKTLGKFPQLREIPEHDRLGLFLLSTMSPDVVSKLTGTSSAHLKKLSEKFKHLFVELRGDPDAEKAFTAYVSSMIMLIMRMKVFEEVSSVEANPAKVDKWLKSLETMQKVAATDNKQLNDALEKTSETDGYRSLSGRTSAP